MGYETITDVDDALLEVLRENLVPEAVSRRDMILACTPGERGGAVVGISLYDIQKNEEVLSGGMFNLEEERQRYPSLFVSLYYMISVCTDSDIKFRSRAEHQILGRIMQILHDTPILMEERMGQLYKVKLELEWPNGEEKEKKAGREAIQGRAALFYKVYPVEIESAKTRRVKRVSQMDYHVDETKGGETAEKAKGWRGRRGRWGR